MGRSKPSFIRAFAVSLTCLVVLSPCTAAEPAKDEITLEIVEPRPLSVALRDLSDRHGWVITYEDPRWSHPDDLEDQTAGVQGAVERVAQGLHPPLRIPRVQPLRFSYPRQRIEGGFGARFDLVEELLAVYERGNAGVAYELRRDGDVLHVLPQQARDERGDWIEHVSLLDRPLEFPRARRTVMETIDEIEKAINRTSSAEFSLGMVMIEPFHHTFVEVGGEGRTGRELLGEVMSAVDVLTSWVLFYDPTLQTYFFSVYPVRHGGPA